MQKQKEKQMPDRYSLWQKIAFAVLSLLIVFFVGLTVYNLVVTESDHADGQAGQITIRRNENLLDNASFERNPLRDNGDWLLDERGTDLVATWTDRQTTHGEYSVQFTSSQSGNQGWAGLFAIVPLTDGYTYSLSADMLSNDGASGWLVIDLLDADDRFLRGYSTGCPQPVEDWHSRNLVITPEQYRELDDATQMRIGVLQCLNHSEGQLTTLYADHVVLIAE